MEYEPKTLDPQKATDVSATEMSFACLEGLTRIGEMERLCREWHNRGKLKEMYGHFI